MLPSLRLATLFTIPRLRLTLSLDEELAITQPSLPLDQSAVLDAVRCLGPLNGLLHEVGSLCAVSGGDSTFGSKLNILGGDKVDTGVRFPPFAAGDFLWQIPWEFTVDGSTLKQFTVAEHHATADADGRATISKKGAGPFSKLPADPDSSF